VLISWAPIYKYLHHSVATAAMLSGILFLAAGMVWLERMNQRQTRIHPGWFVSLFALFVAAFAVLYPISLKHTLNSGSDREDALRISLSAVQHHEYPNDAHTFLGNPPTPLPGALLLAAPFYVLRHIAWQNFVWLALFFLFTLRFFRYRATALFFQLVFLLLAPANLSDITSGGDYLTNFFYVAIAVALFVRTLGRRWHVCIPAALFLGVTLSSRIVYAVLLMPLLALALQRTSRTRAIGLFAVILGAAAAVTLPVFAPNAGTHLLQQLNQNAGKLRLVPGALHASWSLPLLAVILAGVSFFVRMTFSRVMLAFSVASFVMLAPFVVTFAIHSERLRYNFSYLGICVLPFALWALSLYERIGLEEPDGAGASA
jgi:ABC-type multidrug transport system fused ATPase/permease subunit